MAKANFALGATGVHHFTLVGFAMATGCVYPAMKFDDSGTGGAGLAIGGATAGGTVSSGGTSNGTTATGGVASVGTSTTLSATGGAATGGTSTGTTLAATGGAATGGASPATTLAATGGAATGGASPTTTLATTGGAATGGTGMATGGVGTGGTNAPTGGAATGGTSAATGGAATGGTSAATGGAATGGSANCSSTSIPQTGCRFVPASSPSCANETTLVCQGESCCTAVAMPGGTYPMGRSLSGSDAYFSTNTSETPEHQARVSAFALDKYEVTVSRFREFVRIYSDWRGTGHPASSEGGDPNAANTGWAMSWSPTASDIPATGAALAAALACDSTLQTWTDAAGANESYPINCVNWFEAMAFCIWDGGWLPTEAEWEYVAAGGTENRLFPWGTTTPNDQLAVFGASGSPRVSVGSKLASGGAGYFGHADLAGSAFEWVVDYFSSTFYTASSPLCDNCVSTAFAGARVTRGGGWSYTEPSLRAAFRDGYPPTITDDLFGFRCARRIP